MKVLLVEDDSELAAVLEQGFTENGIRVSRAANVFHGRELALDGGFDVIVLDVLLPGGDGFQLCEGLRRSGIRTPIVMLTAVDAVDDRVHGLSAGADDYVVKPFEFKELLARVRAVARRPAALIPDRAVFDTLEIDFAGRRAYRDGKLLELTAKEFDLLELFARNRGRVIDRMMITDHVWDPNHDPFGNVIEVLVSRLRRKVDDGHQVKLIHTRRGVGYVFGP